jgi:hypothetical protein
VKYFFAILIFAFVSNISPGQSLNVSAGRLVRVENFPSHFIPARNIDIWLPNNYSFSRKYRVLYMQDGQFLFNPDQNHPEWKMDETLDSLLSKSVIQDCIVVGIWNAGFNSKAEYFPQKVLDHFSSSKRRLFVNNQLRNNPHSDDYLKFIVYELKPYIDHNFSVFRESTYTYIAGSGDGALISLYAVCEYPSIFHAAACFDIYQQPEFQLPKFILKYLKKYIPDPLTHSFYFDSAVFTPDEPFTSFQQDLDELFQKKKYANNYRSNFITNEMLQQIDWNKRLCKPLLFLLKKEEKTRDER